MTDLSENKSMRTVCLEHEHDRQQLQLSSVHALFLALDLAHCSAHLTTRDRESCGNSVKSLVHCLLLSVQIYRSPYSSTQQHEAYKQKSNIYQMNTWISSLYLTSEGEDNFLLLCQHLGVAPEEGLSLRDKYQNAHRSPPLHFRLVLRFQNVHMILCRTL